MKIFYRAAFSVGSIVISPQSTSQHWLFLHSTSLQSFHYRHKQWVPARLIGLSLSGSLLTTWVSFQQTTRATASPNRSPPALVQLRSILYGSQRPFRHVPQSLGPYNTALTGRLISPRVMLRWRLVASGKLATLDKSLIWTKMGCSNHPRLSQSPIFWR